MKVKVITCDTSELQSQLDMFMQNPPQKIIAMSQSESHSTPSQNVVGSGRRRVTLVIFYE